MNTYNLLCHPCEAAVCRSNFTCLRQLDLGQAYSQNEEPMTRFSGRLQMENDAALREAQKAAEADRLHALEADYEATLARLQSSMQQAEQQSALQVRRPPLPPHPAGSALSEGACRER